MWLGRGCGFGNFTRVAPPAPRTWDVLPLEASVITSRHLVHPAASADMSLPLPTLPANIKDSIVTTTFHDSSHRSCGLVKRLRAAAPMQPPRDELRGRCHPWHTITIQPARRSRRRVLQRFSEKLS
jgi:hypothetical protein